MNKHTLLFWLFARLGLLLHTVTVTETAASLACEDSLALEPALTRRYYLPLIAR